MGEKKIGRPASENPPTIRLSVCIDSKTKSQIAALSDKLNLSQSAAVRHSINELYTKLTEEDLS